MLPGVDAVTDNGGLAQRLGGLEPVQALDQQKRAPSARTRIASDTFSGDIADYVDPASLSSRSLSSISMRLEFLTMAIAPFDLKLVTTRETVSTVRPR